MPTRRDLIMAFLAMGSGLILTTSGCSTLWHESHGGVRYSIHPDQRLHRIEKGTDGRLMYDSPELTVVVDQGRLMVNGADSGPVGKGDHVEITDIGTVLVNKERRADSTTNQQAPERVELSTRNRTKQTAVKPASHETDSASNLGNDSIPHVSAQHN